MRLILLLLTTIVLACCNDSHPGTFAYDVERLEHIGDLQILQAGESAVAVSGRFQGRVFTSTVAGMEGNSLGWINWALIDSDDFEKSQAGWGGEGRLWFGPEWGPHAISFDKGKIQNSENFRRPDALNETLFEITDKTNHSVTSRGQMTIQNVDGFKFEIGVVRKVKILGREEIERTLDVELSEDIRSVAFSANSKMTNVGDLPWQKETGLLSLWELGCLHRAENNVVIIPLQHHSDAISSYFTSSEGRVVLRDSTVFYKADANYFNKIGVVKQLSKDVMGSYNPDHNLLTIVKFSLHPDESLYVNSIPDNDNPYAGDVTNIFNGGVVPDTDIDLPFFEFESSSHVKELQPGDSLMHVHSTFHFVGAIEALNTISLKTLGVSLKSIPTFD